ncbi:DUF6443 domain-containing protein [Mucilaginibacter ginsenosidivorax]|nr:DUF6443 domain-containing protein [Mucilaginibacter ginsenosidivorax]
MITKPILASKALNQLLICVCLLFAGYSIQAQTYVSSLSSTGTTGEYYNNNSISLLDGFSSTPAAGQSFHAYITAPDCVPIVSNQTNGLNYILVSIPRVGGITDASQLVNRNTCEVKQVIQYSDGLGRALQYVGIQSSVSDKDIVQPILYDQFGRDSINFLAYGSTVNGGSYHSSALTEQASFYNPSSPGAPNIATTLFPFSRSGFEPSPLSRIAEQGAIGDAWQLTNTIGASSPGHTTRITYGTNNNTSWATDTSHSYQAALFTATTNADQSRTIGRQNNTATYAPSTLTVTVQTDENWKSGRGGSVETYTDKIGRVVLTRKYIYNGGLKILSTYYVYDDFGNLAFVLPPAASPDTGLPSQNILDNLCYQYQYDEWHRLVRKKIPGKDWEYFVYNKLNQLVLSQDGNQRLGNQWFVFKYDALGRQIVSGIWNAGSVMALSTLQANIYAAPQWDTKDNTNNVTQYPTGYVINSYPALTYTLGISYFDNYNIPNLPAAYNNVAAGSKMTSGLLTATKAAILDNNGNPTKLLLAVNYYDDKGQLTKAYQQHYLGAGTTNYANYDSYAINYDFTGQATDLTRSHYNTTNTLPVVTIANNFTYDHTGNLKQVYEQINGGKNVLLAQGDYNEAGQLITKHLHSETGGAPFLQDVNYTYNERGWLRSLNSSSNLLNIDLRYNAPDAGITKQYNGSVAQMLYTAPHGGSKAFSYSYDQLNRVLGASSTGGLLNETISYDLNGNISSLTRGGGSAAQLSYTYQNNGLSNQLASVKNNNTAYRSYSYDPNGNATSDGGSKQIAYNLLNLPKEVDQGSVPLATYTYDATGVKLRNTSSDGSTWDYVDGIVYYNNNIAFIETSEGRAVPNGGAYSYQYNLTDHLGNVRSSFDKDPSTQQVRQIQEDDYYTFGLRKLPGVYDFSNGNRNLYNGKELQNDLTNQDDFGWRFYDPVIGRWNAADQLAENDAAVSPYNYVSNNPVNRIDPDGLWDWYLPDGETDKTKAVWFPGSGAHAGYTNIGPSGWGIYEATGQVEWFNTDGTKSLSRYNLAEVKVVDVKPGPSLAEQALDIGTNFIPIVGSSKDIYQGIRDGNWLQAGLGVGGLILDVATLGSSSLIEGGIKTGVKELAEVGTKELVETEAKNALTNDQLVKRAAEFADEFVTKAKNPGALGTAKHEAATKLLERYQNIYGDRGLTFKEYFNNEQSLGIGNKGFLDVVDHASQKIYDFKFGAAKLGGAQQAKYARNFAGYIIKQIKP